MNFDSLNWEKICSNFWEKRDKRMDNYPLMSSPLPTLFLMGIYLFVCLYLGPKFMQNRKPYKIRRIIILFNIVMVILNIYMNYQFWTLAWGYDYSWTCQPLDRSLNPRSFKIAEMFWIYYICKHFDWIDTLFFILRKKFSHISDLHIYHHTLMPNVAWIAARYMPGGQPVCCTFLNTGIHAVMHTYYAISAMGPKYQKYVWWKKYLSQLQIVQFILIAVNGIPAIVYLECGIDLPHEWGYFFIFEGFIFLYLFGKFYIKTYRKVDASHVSVD